MFNVILCFIQCNLMFHSIFLLPGLSIYTTVIMKMRKRKKENRVYDLLDKINIEYWLKKETRVYERKEKSLESKNDVYLRTI